MLCRKYKSPELYNNFKTAFALGIVSMVFTVLTIISNLLNTISHVTEEFNVPAVIVNSIFTYLISLGVIIERLIFTHTSYNQGAKYHIDIPEDADNAQEVDNSEYNDLIILNMKIWLPFVAWLGVAFYSGYCTGLSSYSLFSFSGGFWYWLGLFGYGLGYWLLPYTSLFIGNIFLSKNKKIIKSEWQINPPQWLQDEQERKFAKWKDDEKQKQDEKCNNLLKTCGMKFFVKYCEQIILLPPRDVTIDENYTQIEKWQRLYAAQRIIKGDYTKLALTKIVNDYGNVLSEKEIEKAKELLEKYGKN